MTKTSISNALTRFSWLAVALMLFATPSFALTAPSTKPVAPASKMSVEEFLSLTPKKYKELTGEKLSFTQKLSLKLAQKKVRKAIKNNEQVDEKVMASAVDTSDFNIGGFILGLLLAPIGVLIAYLIGDSTVIKWAWIGFAVFAVIFIIAILL